MPSSHPALPDPSETRGGDEAQRTQHTTATHNDNHAQKLLAVDKEIPRDSSTNITTVGNSSPHKYNFIL